VDSSDDEDSSFSDSDSSEKSEKSESSDTDDDSDRRYVVHIPNLPQLASVYKNEQRKSKSSRKSTCTKVKGIIDGDFGKPQTTTEGLMLVWEEEKEWKKYKRFAKYLPGVFQSIVEEGKCDGDGTAGSNDKYYVIIDDTAFMGGGKLTVKQELDEKLGDLINTMAETIQQAKNWCLKIERCEASSASSPRKQKMEDFIRYDRRSGRSWFVAVPTEWSINTFGKKQKKSKSKQCTGLDRALLSAYVYKWMLCYLECVDDDGKKIKDHTYVHVSYDETVVAAVPTPGN